MTSLPNFICVGAPKAGTTALHADLGAHPDIFVTPQKETHFFRLGFGELPWNGPGTPPSMEIDSLEKYKNLFSAVKNQKAIGEICPSYFADPATPGHIHDTLGPIKIIIILRDPVKRAFSQYVHARLIGCEPEASFIKAIELEPERKAAQWGEFWSYLGQSHYAPVLRRYIKTFGIKNVLMLRHEDYVSDRFATLQEIYKFLDVDPEIATSQRVSEREVNVSGIPRNMMARFAFRHIEKMAKIARKVMPGLVRKKLRTALNSTLDKATLTDDERRFALSHLTNDISEVETLTGWTLDDWKSPF
ncbi:sulfotransferase [Thalassospira sp. MA62]|nr:sulfotransferase [Thalassospira sp. MA62]